MSLLAFVVIIAAIMKSSDGQVFGDESKLGYQFPIYKDNKNIVTGYGQVQPKPLEIGGGANWKNINGHGAGIKLAHNPAGINKATLSGQLGLINTPQDKVHAYGAHSRVVDNNFRTLSTANQAGLGYQHTNRDGRTYTGVAGGATFIPGFKPQPNIMFGLTHRF